MRLVKCIVYYLLTGFMSFFLGRVLSKRNIKYTSFPFVSFSFEKNGTIYERLNIKSWQKKIPDMSKLFPGIMQKKEILSSPGLSEIENMIKETCIAEITHVFLMITGLGCFRFFRTKTAVKVYIIYFFANLPYIIVQRYNRPRLKRLYAACQKRISAPCDESRDENVCSRPRF